MPQLHSGLIGGSKYQITNSVRLRAAASAYFSRTLGTSTDQKKWSLSMWCKRSALGVQQILMSGLNGAYTEQIKFNSADTLEWNRYNAGYRGQKVSSAVFRDPSAHLHIVMQMDAANTSLKIFVNGAEIVYGTNSNPINEAGGLNGNSLQNFISRNTTVDSFLDGYLSDTYFIDGQALTPSSFGQTDANGVWVPKAYTGTYGANGFHLDFKDANLTAGSNVGLGKDVSGNGNYWTTNNISVTAGVTYDSMVDTPTNNYAVGNQLDQTGVTLSNGNLTIVPGASGNYVACGTVAMTSGKWYWEVKITAQRVAGECVVGVADQSVTLANRVFYNVSGGWYYDGGGLKWNTSTTGTAYGNSYTTGDTISIAYDADNGKLWFAKNGTWQASGDPAAGTNAAFTSGLSGKPIVAAFNNNSSGGTQTYDANFGQRPFTYTPPTGFKALCTANQTITAPTASGTFTGNLNADGPFVWIGGVPTTLTINGNAVTFGTHADKTAGGFKLRTASASYNNTGSNTWSATFASPSTNSAFAHPQPAQGNP